MVPADLHLGSISPSMQMTPPATNAGGEVSSRLHRRKNRAISRGQGQFLDGKNLCPKKIGLEGRAPFALFTLFTLSFLSSTTLYPSVVGIHLLGLAGTMGAMVLRARCI